MSAVNPFQPFFPPPIVQPPPLLQVQPPAVQRNADGLPIGDGTFSADAQGTEPQSELDLQLALMANDAYAADNPKTEAALAEAGWSPLATSTDGTHLVDAEGNRVDIDPSMLRNDDSGFSATIYQNAQGQYVVAYRGSEIGSEKSQYMDWVNNAQQGVGAQSAQYSDATALARRAEQVFGDGNVVTTGHSLGGGLASAGALAIDSAGVTFNSSGLSNNTLEDLGFNPNAVRDGVADSGQIRRYAVDGDPLTAAQEDIPILPIVGSPPDAIGHALRIAPPEGTGTFDLAALHGGGGDDPSYVAALQQNAPYDPAQGPTGSEQLGDLLDTGIDFAGDKVGDLFSAGGQAADSVLGNVGDLLRYSPVLAPGAWLTGTVLDGAGSLLNAAGQGLDAAIDKGSDLLGDGVGAVTGFGGNVLGSVVDGYADLQFNQVSNLINTVGDLGSDTWGNVTEAYDEIATSVREDFAKGDVLEGIGNVVGSVVDANIDTLGDAASGVIGFAGDTVQNLGNAGGGFLRDLGDHTGFDAPFDAVAGFVEGTGSVVSNGADAVGGFVDGALDTVGDAAQATAGFIGDGAQAISDGAGWVADKLNPFN